MIDLGDPAVEFVVAFADDEHLMGQQHTEWIGVAPFLEEDLAFSSIAQDELGHAALLLATLVGDSDEAIDAAAFGRPADDWRSCALVEARLAEWDDTLVRHWLYDSFEELRWSLLAESNVPEWNAISERAAGEERFHRRHVDALLDVLVDQPDAGPRLSAALRRLLPLAFTMFDAVAGEAALVADGTLAGSTVDLIDPWKQRVDDRFGAIDWSAIDAPPATGRRTRHQNFAPLLSRINEVLILDPGARW